jgi:hypothetical protein
MANEQALPDYKLKILTVLAEYKYLTSKQVWDKTGAAMEGKSYTQTRVELDRLKKAGLVRVEQVRGENGRTRQHQWMLLRAGARLINFDKFGKHYQRPLSRYQSDYHKLELDLEEQIELALGDWKLVKRQTGRLPATTGQYSRLCQVLTWQEYRTTGTLLADPFGPHTLMVPLRANQHLAYLPGNKKAVIFILPRPRATERFWQERSKEFGRLAEKMPVYGVFPDTEQLQYSRRILGKLNLQGISTGQVSGLLSRIYQSIA